MCQQVHVSTKFDAPDSKKAKKIIHHQRLISIYIKIQFPFEKLSGNLLWISRLPRTLKQSFGWGPQGTGGPLSNIQLSRN